MTIIVYHMLRQRDKLGAQGIVVGVMMLELENCPEVCGICG